MKLPIGIDDFKELMQGNYTFVDKTLFIKAVLDEGGCNSIDKSIQI